MKIFSRFLCVKKLLFVNKELIEHFRTLKFPKSKIGLLYNHSTVSIEEVILKGKRNPIRIGFIGRVVPLKRVEYLVELAQFFINHEFNDFIIDVIGDGDSLTAVQMGIQSLELDPYIKLHGFQTDVNKFYQSFDLFVNPSQEECLSIAMIDAGMHSLPIVAFNVGGNEEIIIDGLNGYIVNDKQAFFKSCLVLLVNDELRMKMAIQSKIHCIKYFSEGVHKKELMSIYNNILQ